MSDPQPSDQTKAIIRRLLLKSVDKSTMQVNLVLAVELMAELVTRSTNRSFTEGYHKGCRDAQEVVN